MTRSMERFKSDANKFAQIVAKKNAKDVEKQVSCSKYTYIVFFSFGNPCRTAPPCTEQMSLAVFLTRVSLGI